MRHDIINTPKYRFEVDDNVGRGRHPLQLYCAINMAGRFAHRIYEGTYPNVVCWMDDRDAIINRISEMIVPGIVHLITSWAPLPRNHAAKYVALRAAMNFEALHMSYYGITVGARVKSDAKAPTLLGSLKRVFDSVEQCMDVDLW